MPVIPPLPLTDWEAIEGQQATDAPPLPVRPEPLVWFVITSRDNIIESIEGPTTATDAKAMQTKTVESNYGEVAAVIVHKSVASRIRINGSRDQILDAMESQLDRSYSLPPHQRIRF